MARLYSVVFENVAVAAAQDLFDIAPATNKPVRLVGLILSNVGGTADAGDAQEELLRLLVVRGYSTVGSGGTAPTPAPIDSVAGTAAGFTSRVNDTTVASTGSPISLHADGWNIRVPYVFWWSDPETRPGCSAASTRIVVRLVAAPNDSVSCSGTLYVEELG